MRADSTSVWPRLVTELCKSGVGTSPRAGRQAGPSCAGSRGPQGTGEPEEGASTGPCSSPVDLLPSFPELSLAQNKTGAGDIRASNTPTQVCLRILEAGEIRGHWERILQGAATKHS